ncbi:MAG: type VI secretion system protein TssA [Telluria sp.]
MLDIEQLLAPVSEQDPCGDDIRFSSEVDAISRARQADDPTLEQGAWVTSLKEADWKFVAARCAQLIEKRSKDLRLAVWLAEAAALTSSFRGLGDGLSLVAAMCERYWDTLYPRPDAGDQEERIGNLCWIAARAPRLVQELPVAMHGGTPWSMVAFEAARARAGADGAPDPDAVRRQTPRGFYEALLADTAYCTEAIARLERVVDDKLGVDGPGFTAAKAALDGVLHSVTPWAREAGAAAEGAGAGAGAALALTPELVTHAGHMQVGHGPIQTRAHALAQLRQVAEYFRKAEPHSPVAYLADKAAAWGEQPLHVWLRGVVKDDAAFSRIEELLGLPHD